MSIPYIDKKPSSLRYYQEEPPESYDSIDMKEWALKIFLPHESTPILVAFEDLKNIAPITESRRVVCVCNWSIRRNWTGVLLDDIVMRFSAKEQGNGFALRQEKTRYFLH
uniref:hypothetical protein n=1 Tax=Xenorhabdus bovienii TaxID=40576 RepID=UPI0021587BFE